MRQKWRWTTASEGKAVKIEQINIFRTFIAETAGFEHVIDIVILYRENEESVGAATKLKQRYNEADSEVQFKVNETFKKAAASMKVKVVKDLEIMSEIEKPDDFVLPMTNRSNVSID